MSVQLIVHLERDNNGDVFCPIPDEVLDAFGLKEGDELTVELFNRSILVRPMRALMPSADLHTYHYACGCQHTGHLVSALCPSHNAPRVHETAV